MPACITVHLAFLLSPSFCFSSSSIHFRFSDLGLPLGGLSPFPCFIPSITPTFSTRHLPLAAACCTCRHTRHLCLSRTALTTSVLLTAAVCAQAAPVMNVFFLHFVPHVTCIPTRAMFLCLGYHMIAYRIRLTPGLFVLQNSLPHHYAAPALHRLCTASFSATASACTLPAPKGAGTLLSLGPSYLLRLSAPAQTRVRTNIMPVNDKDSYVEGSGYRH